MAAKRKTMPQKRKRPLATFTLSEGAIARLHDIAERKGMPAGRVVEELIWKAELPRRLPTEGSGQ